MVLAFNLRCCVMWEGVSVQERVTSGFVTLYLRSLGVASCLTSLALCVRLDFIPMRNKLAAISSPSVAVVQTALRFCKITFHGGSLIVSATCLCTFGEVGS